MAIRRRVERALSRWADPVLAAAAPPEPAPGTLTILAFHSITREPREKIDVTPERLEQILDAIADGPAEVVAVGRALDALAEAAGPPRIALTFDDAYPDFASLAVPLLARRGLPATVGVVTGAADSGGELPFISGRGRRSMRWPEIVRLLRDHGELVTVANHSHRHRDVTRLERRELDRDLELSQARFQAELGITPEVFVYPFGFVDRASREAVASRFRLGLTGSWGTNRSGADRATLDRITCFDHDGAATRRLKIAGRATTYGVARDLAVAVAPWLRG